MTEKKWFLVDAKDKVVGRLATQIATVLIGKNKRTYTPGTDNGDFVVVINSDSLVFTGKKLQHKFLKFAGAAVPWDSPPRPQKSFNAFKNI
mgnify:CR=1 FL=1